MDTFGSPSAGASATPLGSPLLPGSPQQLGTAAESKHHGGLGTPASPLAPVHEVPLDGDAGEENRAGPVGGHVDNSVVGKADGISLHYMETVVMKEIRDRGLDPHTTTIYDLDSWLLRGDALAGAVCPEDGRPGSSYINAIPRNADNVGEANVMISYCWGYTIGAIVDALSAMKHPKFDEVGHKRIYVWICCLCINQFRIKEATPSPSCGGVDTGELVRVFGSRIHSIGHVAMMMAPWENPLYLTRVWCIFELAVAHLIGASYEIIMPPAEEDELTERLADRFVDVMGAIAAIDIEKAHASQPEDKRVIFEHINTTFGGAAKFNSQVIQTLREWLLRMATSRLAHKRRQLQLIRHAEPEAYQNAHDAMRSSSMRQGRLSDRLGRELTVTTAALAPADLGHSEQPPTAAKQGNAAADATDADPATEADTGAVSAPADALTTVMVELDRLRMGCGHLQQHLGALSHAKALFEQSLQAREKAYGTVDDLVAECLEALADIERLQGHFAAAEGLLTRALKIQQEVLGPTSPQVAGTLADLGRVLAKLRRFDEADKAYLSSLDIFDRYDLPEHTAAVFNNLGRMYTKQRNYPAAETVLRRSIAILEQLESAGHRGVGRELAAALTSMAIIAPHAEAGPLYRRVLPMREAMYGLQHPEYAAALNNLGSWLQESGKSEQAECHFREAHEVWEEALGPDHPDVAVALNNIASSLGSGRHAAAEVADLNRRALEIKELHLPPDHPDLAVQLSNYARVLLQQDGDLGQAEQLAHRAQAIYVTAHGADHPEVAECMGLHAMVLIRQLERSGAEPQRQIPALVEVAMTDILRLLRNRLQILEPAAGFRGVATAAAVRALIDFYLAHGRAQDARELLHRALASLGGGGDTPGSGGEREATPGPVQVRRADNEYEYSPEAAAFVYGNALAGLLCELNEPGESEAMYATCLALPGLDPSDTVALLTKMADLLANQAGREDDAIEVAKRAIAIERGGGWPSAEAARTLATLGVLYKRRGLPAESERALRDCVAVTKAKAGLDHKETAKALNTWGTALKKVGLLEDAVAAYDESHAIYEALYGSDHTHTLTVLKNLKAAQKKSFRENPAPVDPS